MALLSYNDAISNNNKNVQFISNDWTTWLPTTSNT